jgi:molecular chaperone IbpA
MTNIKAFGQFSPFSVGFDDIFNTLQRASIPQSNYPPYNIIKKGETYFIEIAMAGFKKSDIDIQVEDNTLTISANYLGRENDVEFIHKGISEREFYKSFALAEYVEVKKAKIVDGILIVELEKNIPEEQKPKKIKISS